MLQFGEKLPFVQYRVNAFLADYFGFVHFLHGVDPPRFFETNRPHFSEATLADDVLAVEPVAVDLVGFSLFIVALPFRQVDFETVFDVLP